MIRSRSDIVKIINTIQNLLFWFIRHIIINSVYENYNYGGNLEEV